MVSFREREIFATISLSNSGMASAGELILFFGVIALMLLIRKILDRISQNDQNSFLILRLFCNWTAHIKITKSNVGIRILAKVNNVLVKIKDSTDTAFMQNEIAEAIGFSILYKEIKTFLKKFDIDNVLVSSGAVLAVFIENLIEIIRDVSISFSEISQLSKTRKGIYDEIAKNAIKIGAGVLSIKISQIDYSALGINNAGKFFCLFIRTEDTTTIIVPLSINIEL